MVEWASARIEREAPIHLEEDPRWGRAARLLGMEEQLRDAGYAVTHAADVPNIEVTHAPTPCPHTPLGSRGIGEGRPSAIPGALSNAICDALTPFGIEITELPLRPDKIWHMLQDAKTRVAAD